MRKFFFGFGIIVIFIIGGFVTMGQTSYFSLVEKSKQTNSEVVKYIPVGDSYTIGNGVLEKDRWPNVMVGNLKSEGVDIELIKNPAVSGYTVRDAIEHELSVLEREKPDFVTVLIGANDNFSGEDVAVFSKDLSELLDGVQKNVSDPKRVLLITIPDYTKSPAAFGYSNNSYEELIREYNKVIFEEGEKRGLKVADIFPISQTMRSEDFYIADELHPSAKGYLLWEKVIREKVLEILKN